MGSGKLAFCTLGILGKLKAAIKSTWEQNIVRVNVHIFGILYTIVRMMVIIKSKYTKQIFRINMIHLRRKKMSKLTVEYSTKEDGKEKKRRFEIGIVPAKLNI